MAFANTEVRIPHRIITSHTTLEATQGQIDAFFSQPSYTCYQNRAASVGD